MSSAAPEERAHPVFAADRGVHLVTSGTPRSPYPRCQRPREQGVHERGPACTTALAFEPIILRVDQMDETQMESCRGDGGESRTQSESISLIMFSTS